VIGKGKVVNGKFVPVTLVTATSKEAPTAGIVKEGTPVTLFPPKKFLFGNAIVVFPAFTVSLTLITVMVLAALGVQGTAGTAGTGTPTKDASPFDLRSRAPSQKSG
jgi:hypothetical protein